LNSIFTQFIPVKKGQFIAYSGNTGGSRARILFEIRRTSDEACLNPLLFDFNIYDVTPRFGNGWQFMTVIST
jgi:murein DD-endopeptidase MepM/ murein hydrolase activator NlpD